MQKCFKSTLFFAITFMMAGSLSAQTEQSINDVERILVTADFRDSGLYSLSNSVSILDQDVIARRGAQHIQQLLNLAPNVNFSEGASRGRFFQIRGIGERSQFIDPVNPSVGLIIDGIDFTGLGLAASTLDIQQVEIFRGPQGTLYGANALAGLINLKSNDPTDDFSVRLGGELAEFGGLTLDSVVSAPISDKAGYRVAARLQKSDGFTNNAFLERDDTNNIDEATVRGKLNFDISDDLFMGFTVFYINADNGYDAFSLNNSRTTTSDQPGEDTQRSLAGAAQIKWQAPEAFSVEVLLSAADSKTSYSFDEDWSFIGEFPDDFGPYSSADSYQRERSNFTTDIRLISADGQKIWGQSTSWVLGAYLRLEDEDLLRTRFADLQFDGTFENKFETTNLAVYGQLTSTLSENITLVSGLRLEQRDADYSDSLLISDSVSEDLWGGRLVLEYRPVQDTLLYASVSRGYKPGGVNGQIISESADNPNIPTSIFIFDTETLVNFEVGIKGRWFDGRFRSQLALFYQDRNDAQVGQSIFTPPRDFDEYLDNAPAKARGIELESQLSVTQNLEIYANLGLLDAEFKEFLSFAHVNAQSTGEPFELTGRQIAHAPEYQLVTGVNYYINDNWLLNIEFEGKGSFFFSNTHDDKSNSNQIFNMRLSYYTDDWTISMWGRNLTDEDIQTRGFFFSNEGGNNPGNGYAPEPYYQFGEPRIFGISATYEF